MLYNVVFDKRAEKDIQQAIDYYDDQQIGLGEKFWLAIKEHIRLLRVNPFFQVRYNFIRCLPVKHFPFMIHFKLNESQKVVYVISVLHTSLNPEKWMK